jgi:hypothetical protein
LEVFISYKGGIYGINVSNGKDRNIEFEAAVNRDVRNTIRFQVDIPQKTAATRSHRWSQKTHGGILFEALGDLYLKKGSKLTNLTESSDHETNPVYDPVSKTIYYASWNDKDMGSIYKMNMRGKNRKKLTRIKSQYGSISISKDGKKIAYMRGAGSLTNGKHLESQQDFVLAIINKDGRENVLTEIGWSGNRYAKRPPTVYFGSDNRIYFSEYVKDILTIKSITHNGLDKMEIAKFTNATRAVISPDMKWVAFREYHRSFITPFEFVGQVLTIATALQWETATHPTTTALGTACQDVHN